MDPLTDAGAPALFRDCAGGGPDGATAGRGRPRPSGRVLALRGLLLLLPLAGCALPRWPLQGPVTSPYGLRLVGWSPEVHRGIDIAAKDGTPVVAMKGGTVLFAGTRSGYGTVVILKHGGSTRTVYGHLSALKVKAGDHVDAGQVIALSGHSGNARGPHLHFEIQRWGEPEDPVPLLGGTPDQLGGRRR